MLSPKIRQTRRGESLPASSPSPWQRDQRMRMKELFFFSLASVGSDPSVFWQLRRLLATAAADRSRRQQLWFQLPPRARSQCARVFKMKLEKERINLL
ncbi:hypothetical protein OJAV_G00187260 [Oryzias javanicus]|uniref:Uncharacterized protein n=1 Tax=Oryzias javanicus TaxID=123683 RepID=A0A437C966_ORYJA|nr:hypothetical protein OJAV_G00187260 [Oryzias javanicus]